MTHRSHLTDRSPLATAVVSLSTVAVFFGVLVAISYPVPAAAAVFGAALARVAPRAIEAARTRLVAELPDRTGSGRPRTGSHGRHS